MEVNRVDRRLRRAAGKSDTIDAEAAARAVLAGQATATPKTADGAVEMMRQLKVARDSAVKARTTAMSTLKQILVNAPPVLREPLQALTDRALVTRDSLSISESPKLSSVQQSAAGAGRSAALCWLDCSSQLLQCKLPSTKVLKLTPYTQAVTPVFGLFAGGGKILREAGVRPTAP